MQILFRNFSHTICISDIKMLKFFIYILIIAVVCGSMFADHPEKEVGYCHVDGLRIKLGERVPAPIGECYDYQCDKADGENESISSLTCAEWRLAPGSKCHKSEIDLTKPYPECCPRKVCPDD